jgi:hypothetical protein
LKENLGIFEVALEHTLLACCPILDLVDVITPTPEYLIVAELVFTTVNKVIGLHFRDLR